MNTTAGHGLTFNTTRYFKNHTTLKSRLYVNQWNNQNFFKGGGPHFIVQYIFHERRKYKSIFNNILEFEKIHNKYYY